MIKEHCSVRTQDIRNFSTRPRQGLRNERSWRARFGECTTRGNRNVISERPNLANHQVKELFKITVRDQQDQLQIDELKAGIWPDLKAQRDAGFINEARGVRLSEKPEHVAVIAQAENILKQASGSQENKREQSEPTLESFVLMPSIHFPSNDEQKGMMERMEWLRKKAVEAVKTPAAINEGIIDEISRSSGILPLIQTRDGGWVRVHINEVYGSCDKRVNLEYFKKNDDVTSRPHFWMSLSRLEPKMTKEGVSSSEFSGITIHRKGETRPHYLAGLCDDNVQDTTPQVVAIGEYLLSYYLREISLI